MRIKVVTLADTPIVRDLLDKARDATTLAEGAYFTRLARLASKGANA
jgi:hypothetical protein